MVTTATTEVASTRHLWRSRWAAIGAAIAVSLGAGGLYGAQAAPGPSESTIVSIAPERILDTRDPNDVGLAGPFVSASAQKLQVTGSIPTATGAKTVVPSGATGVLLNVTPVSPTAAGFISIRPGDATGAATTSSLNFTAGGILPNAVQVAVPTSGANAGQIDITYDAYGVAGPTTDILIDVVGYTTNAGLQQLVADVAAKANAADVYTKAQVDSGFVPQGEIVMSDYPFLELGTSPTASIQVAANMVVVTGGSGFAHMALEGPRRLGTINYGLKSVTYCIDVFAPAFITTARVVGFPTSGPDVQVTDPTDRTADGCYTIPVNDGNSESWQLNFVFSGGSGSVGFRSATTTWSPASILTSVNLEQPVDQDDSTAGG